MLSSTKGELKGSAQTLRNEALETANEVKEDAREIAHRVGDKVRGFLHTANDEIVHATDAVTTQIRSKPIQSSLIALGAGFLLGALFRR